MRRSMKIVGMLLAGGMMFQFGGCLGGVLNSVVRSLPGALAAEYLLDNDGVFDLFEDGAAAAAPAA